MTVFLSEYIKPIGEKKKENKKKNQVTLGTEGYCSHNLLSEFQTQKALKPF